MPRLLFVGGPRHGQIENVPDSATVQTLVSDNKFSNPWSETFDIPQYELSQATYNRRKYVFGKAGIHYVLVYAGLSDTESNALITELMLEHFYKYLKELND